MTEDDVRTGLALTHAINAIEESTAPADPGTALARSEALSRLRAMRDDLSETKAKDTARARETPGENTGNGKGPTARVRVSRDGAVATVTIDSPARRNALSVEVALGLQDAMAELGTDAEVRCVILRGAGGRAFSAGADISEFATWRVNKRRGRIYAGILGAALDAVRTCRHPTIALIEGDCVGGGSGSRSCATFGSAAFPAASGSR